MLTCGHAAAEKHVENIFRVEVVVVVAALVVVSGAAAVEVGPPLDLWTIRPVTLVGGALVFV